MRCLCVPTCVGRISRSRIPPKTTTSLRATGCCALLDTRRASGRSRELNKLGPAKKLFCGFREQSIDCRQIGDKLLRKSMTMLQVSRVVVGQPDFAVAVLP